MNYWRILWVLLIFCGCSDSTEPPKPVESQEELPNDDPNIVNILFIGNSLTFYNQGVDFHVQQFYDEAPPSGRIISTQQRALPGYTLDQHLNNVGSMNILNNTDWDIVVLQENGDHARANPEDALASFNTFKDFFDGKPTKVYLFMTWAYTGFPEMTNQLESVYYEAAAATGFTVLPVGLGWEDVNVTNPSYELLSPDGVHPSLHGTYFSAAMIYEILSGQVVTDNGYNPQLQAGDAIELKAFAHQAVENHYN